MAMQREATIPTCREVAELVSDYLDGATSLSSRLGVRLHLVQCDACCRYLSQMRRTIRLLADLPAPRLPDGVADKVVAEMRRRNVQHAAGD